MTLNAPQVFFSLRIHVMTLDMTELLIEPY